jgi:uncharacterized repeat protein (TIGR01451 family)
VALTPTAPTATVTATLTMNYNALANTPVALSLQGGIGSTVIILPTSPVSIAKGSQQQTFTVSVHNTGTTTAQTYTITATFTLPSGLQPNTSVQLSVTGFVPPPAAVFGTQINPINFAALIPPTTP